MEKFENHAVADAIHHAGIAAEDLVASRDRDGYLAGASDLLNSFATGVQSASRETYQFARRRPWLIAATLGVLGYALYRKVNTKEVI